MPDRSRKKPAKRKPADEDENVIARRIVNETTKGSEQDPAADEPEDIVALLEERERAAQSN